MIKAIFVLTLVLALLSRSEALKFNKQAHARASELSHKLISQHMSAFTHLAEATQEEVATQLMMELLGFFMQEENSDLLTTQQEDYTPQQDERVRNFMKNSKAFKTMVFMTLGQNFDTTCFDDMNEKDKGILIDLALDKARDDQIEEKQVQIEKEEQNGFDFSMTPEEKAEVKEAICSEKKLKSLQKCLGLYC